MIYTTIQGDTWDSIAYQLLGHERHMTVLMKANPDWTSMVVFPAGIELTIPVITAPSAAALPPWKRRA